MSARRPDGWTGPAFVVYVDAARGLALVRGKRIIVESYLDWLGVPYQWSREAWGAVVAAPVANDLPALANFNHDFCVVTSNAPPDRR